MTDTFATVEDLVVDEVSDNWEDVTLPGGKRVRVRGLSRYELLSLGKGAEDADEIERRQVAACLLIPTVTPAQVGQWQKGTLPHGTLKLISETIRDLSGLGKGAAKSDLAEAAD
jgi:hypothetical protein